MLHWRDLAGNKHTYNLETKQGAASLFIMRSIFSKNQPEHTFIVLQMANVFIRYELFVSPIPSNSLFDDSLVGINYFKPDCVANYILTKTIDLSGEDKITSLNNFLRQIRKCIKQYKRADEDISYADYISRNTLRKALERLRSLQDFTTQEREALGKQVEEDEKILADTGSEEVATRFDGNRKTLKKLRRIKNKLEKRIEDFELSLRNHPNVQLQYWSGDLEKDSYRKTRDDHITQRAKLEMIVEKGCYKQFTISYEDAQRLHQDVLDQVLNPPKYSPIIIKGLAALLNCFGVIIENCFTWAKKMIAITGCEIVCDDLPGEKVVSKLANFVVERPVIAIKGVEFNKMKFSENESQLSKSIKTSAKILDSIRILKHKPVEIEIKEKDSEEEYNLTECEEIIIYGIALRKYCKIDHIVKLVRVNTYDTKDIESFVDNVVGADARSRAESPVAKALARRGIDPNTTCFEKMFGKFIRYSKILSDPENSLAGLKFEKFMNEALDYDYAKYIEVRDRFEFLSWLHDCHKNSGNTKIAEFICKDFTFWYQKNFEKCRANSKGEFASKEEAALQFFLKADMYSNGNYKAKGIRAFSSKGNKYRNQMLKFSNPKQHHLGKDIEMEDRFLDYV